MAETTKERLNKQFAQLESERQSFTGGNEGQRSAAEVLYGK
ncbi:hypothetical protein NXZ31_16215 [Escherichia coli]|nr:hypothetical protein [Escherichia coli]